jgi:hypothetical protein
MAARARFALMRVSVHQLDGAHHVLVLGLDGITLVNGCANNRWIGERNVTLTELEGIDPPLTFHAKRKVSVLAASVREHTSKKCIAAAAATDRAALL